MYPPGPSGEIQGSVRLTGLETKCVRATGITKVNGCLVIGGSAALEDISLPNLISVEGKFQLIANDAVNVVSVPNLSNATLISIIDSIGGNSGNGTSIRFEDLSEIARIELVGNKGLADVQLPALEVLKGSLHITSNDALTGLDLPKLANITQDFIFAYNCKATKLEAPALVGVGEDFEVFGNEALERIVAPDLVEIHEDMEVYENPSLVALGGDDLRSLRMVEEDLEIWKMTALLSVELPSLRSVGEDLELFDDFLLNDVRLPALEHVEEDFEMYLLNSISNFEFPALKYIGEDLLVFGNPKLTSLTGMGNLTSLGEGGGGGVLIENNRALTKIFFPNLVGLGNHSERCDDNDGTKQVELYAGATDVPMTGSRPLQVSWNPALTSVSMPALTGLRTNAWVQYNEVLEEFNIDAVEVLNAVYFVFRHNAPEFGNVSLAFGNEQGPRLRQPELSNLYCNTESFCMPPEPAPWADPQCSVASNWCPDPCWATELQPREDPDRMYAIPGCTPGQPLDCTNAFYLYMRENDFDFEENMVYPRTAPQFSAIHAGTYRTSPAGASGRCDPARTATGPATVA
jgi:hypothetical protein